MNAVTLRGDLADAIRRHDVDEVDRILREYEARDKAEYLELRRDKRLKDAERYLKNIQKRSEIIMRTLQRTRELREVAKAKNATQ